MQMCLGENAAALALHHLVIVFKLPQCDVCKILVNYSLGGWLNGRKDKKRIIVKIKIRMIRHTFWADSKSDGYFANSIAKEHEGATLSK